MEKVIELLLNNRHIGTNSKCRHTMIAYGYSGNQLIYAFNNDYCNKAIVIVFLKI